MPYKAVLFDANLTLWEWPGDSAETVFGVLHFLEKPTDLDQVKKAFERVETDWFIPRLLEVETGGRGISLEEARSLVRRRDVELLKRLDIPDRTGLVRSAIQTAFSSRKPALYPDVAPLIHQLWEQGIKMAVVSNGWQQEYDAGRLGIAGYFGAIVGSAHVGYKKPMPEIFQQALEKLAVAPEDAVHVGDHYEEDVLGAQGAGVEAVLLRRNGDGRREDVQTITSLSELLAIIDSSSP